MSDIQPSHDTQKPSGGFRFTKEWGVTFIAILAQIVIFSFWSGVNYFRLDSNVTKTDMLIVKFDTSRVDNDHRFERIAVYMGELKSNYDAIKERLVRLENKSDGGTAR